MSTASLPLFRNIDPDAGMRMGTVGLRSLSWTIPTLLLAIALLAGGVFAATASYARRQPTIGALAPAAGAVRMTPPRAGLLAALHVSHGEVVAAGNPLFTLDFAQSLDGGGTLDAALREALERQDALLCEQLATEATRGTTERARLEARLAGLAAETRALAAQRSLQDRRAALAEERALAAADLRRRGLLSETEARMREDAALSHRQDLAALDQRLAAMAQDAAQTALQRDTLATEAADREARLRSALNDLERQRAEIAAQRALVVRAPVAGRVTSVQAAPGQRANPQRPVLTLVPEGSELRAELFVPSRAIGFVRPGQSVRLMYDAFPFQHFGTHRGTVESVSEAMLAPEEVAGPVKPQGPAYRVSVRLDRATLAAGGRELPLQPDMTLRADIVLEERSLIAWLLEPLISARGRM
ncbi:HlyD family secretion protein [Falsiroseomonas sp.]|uniref:HlyD family secretion protein n=1 Tax=Falsiroseomonas sp. TaxID=2870721 RepID=UPI003565D189